MPGSTSILIVDDHPIFRKGLRSLIDAHGGFTIVGEAQNRTDAMEIVKTMKPGIVLLDLSLGHESGLDLLKDIRAAAPSIAILVLSMHNEKYYAERVLVAGARGYIMKQEADQNVMEAISTVAAGKIWLSAGTRERMLEYKAGQHSTSEDGWLASVKKLSDREFEILALIGKGFGTSEIASVLNINAKTIDTHKEHIKQKLHCKTSQEMRHLAIEWQTSHNVP